MDGPDYELHPIGWVESQLKNLADAPRQGDEGAPEACLVMEASVLSALKDLSAGDEVIVLTWLHLARRDVLAVHPRGDASRPLTGVFSTRSADRPNPIGLHPVRVIRTEGARIYVSGLEAVDGTPVIDIKPVLAPQAQR